VRVCRALAISRRKYRGRIQIAADMIEIARNGSNKTRIMYQANLSFELLEKYLQLLIGSGMLETRENGKGFVATPKGLELLADYRALVEHSEIAESKRRALEASLAQQI